MNTETEAKAMACCAGISGACQASGCMAWRWEPLLADDAFQAAVLKAAAELGDTCNKHKSAKHVAENRAQYGLPTAPFRGWCGLAGKP